MRMRHLTGFLTEWKASPQHEEIVPADPATAANVSFPVQMPLPLREIRRPVFAMNTYGIAVMLYLAGLLALLARLLLGMALAFRLARGATRGDQAFHSPQCRIPLSVGLMRPRVLLPAHSKNWAREDLDAVLAHEWEHVRRRDPLVEWLATLNRCIYWFHPLAWGLRRKLAALAEQACDEAVISRGHDPGNYAELLLELARSVKRGGSLVAIGGSPINGSTLAVRIRRILTAGESPALSRTRIAFLSALCTCAIIIPAAIKPERVQAHLSLRPPLNELIDHAAVEGRATRS
jgi:hypothetical protein